MYLLLGVLQVSDYIVKNRSTTSYLWQKDIIGVSSHKRYLFWTTKYYEKKKNNRSFYR